MNTKFSFENQSSLSAGFYYTNKSPVDTLKFKKFNTKFDNFSNITKDKTDNEDTNYTVNINNDFTGVRRLPDNLASVRETFSYIPRSSYTRLQFQNNYKASQHNTSNKYLQDLRQTMNVRNNRKKSQSYFNKLQLSTVRLNQGYIKSENQYSINLDRNEFKNKYRKDHDNANTFSSDYDKINNINNNSKYDLKNVLENDPIKRLKQERQKKKNNLPIDSQDDIKYVKSNVEIPYQKEIFVKKNYVEYYTPKVEKKPSIHRLSGEQSPSPALNKLRKDTSFDKLVVSPQKVTNIKSLKSEFEEKSSKSIKPRKSFNYKLSSDDFIIGKSLGQGRFGTANLAFHKLTGALFAIKKIKKETIKSNKLIDQFILQVKLQSYLIHPFILKIYGMFDDEQYIYIILEFMEQGSLFNYLKKQKKIPENDVAVKMRYIAQAIKYLQDRGIAHRDIKPENIIMTHNVCKLADFGWATFCDEQRRKTYCGTCDYVAPQILEGQDYDQTVDLWCMGVLAYELITGKAPFYHMSRKQTMKKIMNVSIEYPSNIGQESKSFIEGLIQKDPENRMSIEQTLNHAFIKKINLNQ